ncbi:NAD(P)H-hydrate epimerase [Herbiconiux sp. CPCC 203407]|uniref:NAD(P)H-hydrate epimerase n=1 Tax=Herbiconiux oxytropis TaxID=2970915 RepID=A0AA41XGB9_9MICO|nr:NAD(P)H-hydrate epimerase [Herbiconiux oxytropis]MCS5723323.1 NAD(P)H-hydrate epimerase [Herbiconiux oxytropis]MCS5727502.1 NAD(P)H-hydrate epimerase [Herbiconiux oxytropis]
MTSGYTARQVRDAEAPHLAAGEPLMQRAAHGLATEIRRVLDGASAASAGRGRPPAGGVLLLVGSGDNGGDALFAGAELAASGVEVRAIGVGSRMHEAGSEAAHAAGVRFVETAPEAPPGLPALLRETAVIVDGILGTGTTADSPALRGAAREVVHGIRAELAALSRELPEGVTGPLVVAVDIPSGIDPDSGETADDIVLPADLTVTFGGVKAGLLRGHGARLAGEVVLVEIGIEGDLAAVEPAVRT